MGTHIFRRAAAVILVFALLSTGLTGCAGSGDPRRIVRIGHNQATDHPTHQALLAFETWVEERLGDFHARGVTVKPGQTLRDLYNERCPMYERHAHVTIPCDGLRLREVVAQIRQTLGLNA